jgi:hypothetical protein
VHSVLNRCSFERAPGEPEVDLAALVAKVRGASAGARAVCAAVATKSWLPNADMSKLLQRLDVIGKTSSVAKAGKALEGVAEPSDHVRAHYLLARYVSRSKEDPDPLQTGAAGRRAAKKASQEAQPESDAVVTPAADAPSKSVSSKSGASKTDAPKTGVSKSTASKAVAAKTKKASKPTTKSTGAGSKTAGRTAGKTGVKKATKSSAAAPSKKATKRTTSGTAAKKKPAKSRS